MTYQKTMAYVVANYGHLPSSIFQVGNNGEIVTWDVNVLGAKPTQAQIDAAAPAILMKMLEAELTCAAQKALDDGARLIEYDDMNSLCSYANSTDAIFKAQALPAIAWRDAVWAHCRAVRAAVLDGARPLPTKDELLAELPARPW